MRKPRRSVELSDPRALRAYAHPIRMQLVGLLRREGPLTATRAAQLLGESTGSTSFHLRQLAKYGLVEPAPGGTGRQKPWRATALFTQLPDVAGTPELAEAAEHVAAAVVGQYFERALQWLGRRGTESEAWQRAAQLGDRMLYLTADELAALGEAMDALVEPYLGRLTDATARPADGRWVQLVRLGYPMDAPGGDRWQ